MTEVKLPRACVPVESFQSSTMDDNPHRYPGERPDSSYLTDGKLVMSLDIDPENGDYVLATELGTQGLNEWLSAKGVAEMDDRIPVVAYGANLCPQSLRKKMSYDGREDLQIVPTLYGTMSGVDAVWSERPGRRANFFAELYTGEEVQGTQLQVGINFLTPEQLLFLHKTEPAYEFGTYSFVKLTGGEELPAFVYAGSSRVLLRDGSPIAVAGVNRQGGALPVRGSKETLEYFLSHDEIAEAAVQVLGITPEALSSDTYTAAVLATDPAGRKTTALAMTRAVREAGLSAEFSMSEQVDYMHSWSNPSTVPTYGELRQNIERSIRRLRLPEQELVLDGLSEAALARRQLVLNAVRNHWHERNGKQN